MDNFLAAATKLILKELDEPGVNLFLEGDKVSSQGVFNKVGIGVKRDIPSKFDKSIPALKIML